MARKRLSPRWKVGILLLLTMALQSVFAGRPDEFQDTRTWNAVSRVMTVERGTLHVATVNTIARVFLDKNRKTQIARLMLFDDGQSAMMWSRRLPSDYSHEAWRKHHAPAPKSRVAAEVLKLGNSAGIRTFNSAGSMQNFLMFGSGVFEHDTGHGRATLVHLEVVNRPKHSWLKQEPEVWMCFETVCANLIRYAYELCESLKSHSLTLPFAVVVRHDPWFVRSGDMPGWNPFVEARQLPAPKLLFEASEVVCVVKKGDVQCMEWGRRRSEP